MAAQEEQGEGPAEAPLDLAPFLADMVARNRHVSAMALVRSEGSDALEGAAPLAAGMAVPGSTEAEALNRAFYEGEAGDVELEGMRFAVARRVEVGDFLVVCLEPGGEASSEVATPGQAAQESDAARFLAYLEPGAAGEGSEAGSLIAKAPGAFLCATQRWALVVMYAEGMDRSFAMKVCLGAAEYLVGEGE